MLLCKRIPQLKFNIKLTLDWIWDNIPIQSTVFIIEKAWAPFQDIDYCLLKDHLTVDKFVIHTGFNKYSKILQKEMF